MSRRPRTEHRLGFLDDLGSSALSVWLSTSMTGAPTLIALHSVGMAVVVGLSLMITLRLYGLLDGLEARHLPRILTVAVWGFYLNLITGIGIFITRAPEYARSTTFLVKMLLVLVSAALLIWLRAHLRSARLSADDPSVADASADGVARTIAAAATTTWFAAVVAGRLIAYLSDLYR